MNNIYDIVEKYFYTGDAGQIYDNMINHVEKIVIIKAMERSCGNQIAAAKLLGLHRNTLHSKIKRFNIDIERFKK